MRATECGKQGWSVNRNKGREVKCAVPDKALGTFKAWVRQRPLGAAESVAKRVAANSRRWWRNSAMLLNTVLTAGYFDRLSLPRLPSEE